MSLLELLIVVIVIAWLLGYAFVGSNLVHILLVLLVILVIVRVAQGRKVL